MLGFQPAFGAGFGLNTDDSCDFRVSGVAVDTYGNFAPISDRRKVPPNSG